MTATPWFVEPAADWMTPSAFVVGGAVDQRTEHLRRAHGARCLSMWRDSLHRFAEGAPITPALIERHNRQSLDHWAFARAAAMVQADARFEVRKPEIDLSKPVTGRRAPASTSRAADVRRQFGWGRR